MGRVELIRPVSAGRIMTEEEAREECEKNGFCRIRKPLDADQLSVLLGVDLTPEEDLDKRLTSLIEYTEVQRGGLVELQEAVRNHERESSNKKSTEEGK